MLLLLASFSLAETTLGNCRFAGSYPKRSIITSGMTIRYDEKFEVTGNVGRYTLWEGTGNVWIVVTDPEVYSKNVFIVKGNLQACYGGK